MATLSTSAKILLSKNVEFGFILNAGKQLNGAVQNFFVKQIPFTLNKTIQKKVVKHGQWFAAALLLVVLPELLLFAKEATFMGVSGFFTALFFNQSSWILLLMVLVNCVILVQSINDISAKKRRGWNYLYTALLINLIYVLIQLTQNNATPLAPFVSIAVLSLLLKIVIDLKKYYKK